MQTLSTILQQNKDAFERTARATEDRISALEGSLKHMEHIVFCMVAILVLIVGMLTYVLRATLKAK